MKQMLKSIIFLIVMPAMILPRYHTVKKEQDFNDLINKYEYCIVCFAPSGLNQKIYAAGDEQALLLQNFYDLQNRMQAATQGDDFKNWLKRDIGFLLVDTGSQQASALAKKYGISKLGQCLVFDGEFVVKESLQIAPESASGLIGMLNTQFGPEILDLTIKRKKEKNARTRHEVPIYFELGSYDNNWMPSATYPYSRWGSGPYGVSYDMTGLANL